MPIRSFTASIAMGNFQPVIDACASTQHQAAAMRVQSSALARAAGTRYFIATCWFPARTQQTVPGLKSSAFGGRAFGNCNNERVLICRPQ